MFIIGALLSRLHGSTLFPYKIIKSLLWALPFGIAIYLYLGLLPAIAVTIGCALGKSTGHGRGLNLDMSGLHGKPERTEILISWAQKYLSEYDYKLLILATTGIASMLAFSIAMLFVSPEISILAIIAGAQKATAYLLPHKLGVKEFTVHGELLSGAFAYIILDTIIIMEVLWR